MQHTTILIRDHLSAGNDFALSGECMKIENVDLLFTLLQCGFIEQSRLAAFTFVHPSLLRH